MAEAGGSLTYAQCCFSNTVPNRSIPGGALHRDLQNPDDLHFGVHTDMLYAKAAPPVQGAQWTGIVTRIAMAMLESGQVRLAQLSLLHNLGSCLTLASVGCPDRRCSASAGPASSL